MKVRIDKGENETSYWLWCPACDDAVRIDNTWSFNGDTEKPTFTPSILTEDSHERRCHSFLTNGVWNYLGDCSHAMAGKSVPMVELPDWLAAPTTERGEVGMVDNHNKKGQHGKV